MKKLSLFLAVFAIFCAVMGLLMSAEEDELVIYTKENMFSKATIMAFEKAHPGIRVVIETFKENEEMFDELIRTNGGEYDLVIADDYIVDLITRSDLGLARKLDKSKIPNISNIDPLFMYQFYDPTNEYTIPYGAGVQAIVYDPTKVKVDIKGYADLWNSDLRDSVGIVGDYRAINGMALKVLGKSYNTNNVADIESAGKRLLELVPNIHIISDVGLEEALLSGTISVAIMHTDQLTKARLINPSLKVVYPNEGIGFGIMPAFIPIHAPYPAAAYKFLNFILDPVQGANCFEHLGYYCTFSASEDYLNPALKKLLIVPDLKNLEMIENVSQEAEDQHEHIWENFVVAVNENNMGLEEMRIVRTVYPDISRPVGAVVVSTGELSHKHDMISTSPASLAKWRQRDKLYH